MQISRNIYLRKSVDSACLLEKKLKKYKRSTQHIQKKKEPV